MCTKIFYFLESFCCKRFPKNERLFNSLQHVECSPSRKLYDRESGLSPLGSQIINFRHFRHFSGYLLNIQWFNSILKSITPTCCRNYFSHPSTMVSTYGAGRDHREHREEISCFFTLCASVSPAFSGMRYILFAFPQYIEQLLFRFIRVRTIVLK